VKYIGVDVGKNRCQAYITDQEGKILEEFRFTNDAEGIKRLQERVGEADCKAVVESTGNMWLRIYEALEDRGVEMKLANPLQTKAIASARIKTDKISARILAHLLRADLIPECYVAPRDVRQVRALLRQRTSLVKMRTMVKTGCTVILTGMGSAHRGPTYSASAGGSGCGDWSWNLWTGVYWTRISGTLSTSTER